MTLCFFIKMTTNVLAISFYFYVSQTTCFQIHLIESNIKMSLTKGFFFFFLKTILTAPFETDLFQIDYIDLPTKTYVFFFLDK